MKIHLKYTQHVVEDQDRLYESLDTDWKSLKWLSPNFLAIQMLSGQLKNEQMVILNNFIKRIIYILIFMQKLFSLCQYTQCMG